MFKICKVLLFFLYVLLFRDIADHGCLSRRIRHKMDGINVILNYIDLLERGDDE